MTQSQIFTAAHKLAKTFEGDYSACLALALREIYADMKKENTMTDEHFKLFKDAIERTASGSDFTRVANPESFINLFSVEVKEQEGCKVEFLVKEGIPVEALVTDAAYGDDRELLDYDNMVAAYSDFQSWLAG